MGLLDSRLGLRLELAQELLSWVERILEKDRSPAMVAEVEEVEPVRVVEPVAQHLRHVLKLLVLHLYPDSVGNTGPRDLAVAVWVVEVAVE